MDDVLLLDGPMGTELLARGVPTPLPGWSAHALEEAPDTVAEVHRAYAAAGATVHTTNTFRTRPSVFPHAWRRLAERAAALAREATPAGQRVAGSIAPLEDCYRPDRSPADTDRAGTRARHLELAEVLAPAVDLLLCETFPHGGEALLALDAALETGREVWLALSPGPNADLLTPSAVLATAKSALHAGAGAVLVNCLPLESVPPFLDALAEATSAGGGRFGVYANAGWVEDQSGWRPKDLAAQRYADEALRWHATGATILGSCCGTGPAHVEAVSRALAARAEKRQEPKSGPGTPPQA